MDFRVTSWSCSFCGQQGSAETRLAGGLGAMICTDCLSYYTSAVEAAEDGEQLVTPGWDRLTDAEMLGTLPKIAADAAQVDRFLRQWVSLIRERRISYAEIGKALGVSRQAAWERFSRVVDAQDDDDARSGTA